MTSPKIRRFVIFGLLIQVLSVVFAVLIQMVPEVGAGDALTMMLQLNFVAMLVLLLLTYDGRKGLIFSSLFFFLAFVLIFLLRSIEFVPFLCLCDKKPQLTFEFFTRNLLYVSRLFLLYFFTLVITTLAIRRMEKNPLNLEILPRSKESMRDFLKYGLLWQVFSGLWISILWEYGWYKTLIATLLINVAGMGVLSFLYVKAKPFRIVAPPLLLFSAVLALLFRLATLIFLSDLSKAEELLSLDLLVQGSAFVFGLFLAYLLGFFAVSYGFRRYGKGRP